MQNRPAAESALPSATPAALRDRSKLLQCLRTFLGERDVLEVETPVLSAAGNPDPGMEQFQTREGRWLRTSPEYAMKRLLAGGVGDCFELGRVFRRGEAGTLHNPEFTLLEWYRVGWTYERLAQELIELVQHCGKAFGRQWRPRTVTYSEWVLEATGLDPLLAQPGAIRTRLEDAGCDCSGLGGLDRDGWLDLLVSFCVQPAMPDDQLTLVHLYPASQAALAQLHGPDRRLAERFEVYLGAIELANGYQELTDAAEQRERFAAENLRRLERGRDAVPLDEQLLRALELGLPDCSGVALGVDRLLLALTGNTALTGITAFPWDRA